MKLNELFEIFNDTQYFDVYYKDNNDDLVKCASYNERDSIEDKYNEAEVLNISITKYNTFDILIERVITERKFDVHFEVPTWFIEDFDEEFVFDDDEDDEDIEDRIDEAFREWLDEIVDNIRAYAEKETEEL